MADGDRRTRTWRWVLGAIVVALVVAVVVVLVVVLVTRDDEHDSPAPTTTTRPTTTAPPTTTTVPLPEITDDPQTYAEFLFAAWRNDDRAAAADVASADAVDQMFSQPAPAQGPYTLTGCGPAAGSLYCTWNGQGGATIQMTVRTLTGGLPIQVQAVQFTS